MHMHFKKGEQAEKSSYCLISIISVFSTLFEKVVFNEIYQYLSENDVIFPGQSGFCKDHSTLTCLLKITEIGIMD